MGREAKEIRMTSAMKAAVLVLAAAAAAAAVADGRSAPAGRCGGADVVWGGYWPSWGTLPAAEINTSYLTHVYYAFVTINSTTFRLAVTPADDALLRNFTAALKGKATALLSIGGGDSNSTAFSLMAADAANRRAFIESTVEVAGKYDFDGFDLDWEFPETQADMDNLGRLLDEWKAALRRQSTRAGGCPLLLTAAVYYASHRLFGNNQTYPAKEITESLDWVNAMFYDYHGSWDTSRTGAHTAVFGADTRVTTDYGVRSWVISGVPPAKIMMGLALYGRTWQLENPAVNGIGAPAVGVGPGNGTLLYREIVDYNAAKRADVVHDNLTLSTYSSSGVDWIGYDDSHSISAKIGFAKNRSLGGHFFWAVGYDDNSALTRQAALAW